MREAELLWGFQLLVCVTSVGEDVRLRLFSCCVLCYVLDCLAVVVTLTSSSPFSMCVSQQGRANFLVARIPFCVWRVWAQLGFVGQLSSQDRAVVVVCCPRLFVLWSSGGGSRFLCIFLRRFFSFLRMLHHMKRCSSPSFRQELLSEPCGGGLGRSRVRVGLMTMVCFAARSSSLSLASHPHNTHTHTHTRTHTHTHILATFIFLSVFVVFFAKCSLFIDE